MNCYMVKNTEKYSVELFETKEQHLLSIPHQQLLIDREVNRFEGVIWEPHHAKLAVHTHSKKQLEYGQKQFSNDPFSDFIDMFQLKNEMGSFIAKKMGALP